MGPLEAKLRIVSVVCCRTDHAHPSAYRFRPGEKQQRKTHLLANPRRGSWPMPPTAPAAPENFTLTPSTIQVNNLSGNFQVTEPTMTTEFAPRKRKGNTERA